MRLTSGICAQEPTYTIYQERRTGRGGEGEDSLVFQVKGHGAISNSQNFE